MEPLSRVFGGGGVDMAEKNNKENDRPAGATNSGHKPRQPVLNDTLWEIL
jgi:hypothetical protein